MDVPPGGGSFDDDVAGVAPSAFQADVNDEARIFWLHCPACGELLRHGLTNTGPQVYFHHRQSGGTTRGACRLAIVPGDHRPELVRIPLGMKAEDYVLELLAGAR
jgi:hypothetical protein